MRWLGNPKFMSSLGRNLAKMEKQAREMNAPVFVLEDDSRDEPFKILVYTMLSARTKDETTTAAARRLFQRADSAERIAGMDTKEIEALIRPVGFYRSKAKHLKELCRIVNEKFGGAVPGDLHGLLSLPGVGIKTAHIVLARAFRKDMIGVDTHVHRISNRLGLVNTKTPHETSVLLNEKIPKKYRREFNKIFVAFGQTVCRPINPKCAGCKILKCCARRGLPPL